MVDALFLQVIGGVFLLLYGVRLTGQGFELAFGAKLSRLWVGPGGGGFRAFCLGGRKGTLQAIGQGILGFGLLLLALKFLAGAASEIGSVTSLRLLMADLPQGPLGSFLLGVLLSALFQSGTAVMILLIAFSQHGGLPF